MYTERAGPEVLFYHRGRAGGETRAVRADAGKPSKLRALQLCAAVRAFARQGPAQLHAPQPMEALSRPPSSSFRAQAALSEAV